MLNHLHKWPLSHSPRKPRNTSFIVVSSLDEWSIIPGAPIRIRWPVKKMHLYRHPLNYARDYVKGQPATSKMRSKRNRNGDAEEGSQRGAFDTVQIYGRSYGARLYYYYYYYYSKQEDLRHAITINYARTRLKAGYPPRRPTRDDYAHSKRKDEWCIAVDDDITATFNTFSETFRDRRDPVNLLCSNCRWEIDFLFLLLNTRPRHAYNRVQLLATTTATTTLCMNAGLSVNELSLSWNDERTRGCKPR